MENYDIGESKELRNLGCVLFIGDIRKPRSCAERHYI